MLSPEQLVAAQKARLAALHELTLKHVSSVEKLAQLNVQLLKHSLDDHAEHTHALFSAKSVGDWLHAHSQLWQPLSERAAHYNQQLHAIATELQHEIQHFIQQHGPHQGATPTEAPTPAPTSAPGSGNAKP